jgi:SlyX protein
MSVIKKRFPSKGVHVNEQRLIELETQFSHHESSIEELQKTVFEQYLMIEKLEKNLKLLTERFKSLSAEQNPIGLGTEKPPHY